MIHLAFRPHTQHFNPPAVRISHSHTYQYMVVITISVAFPSPLPPQYFLVRPTVISTSSTSCRRAVASLPFSPVFYQEDGSSFWVVEGILVGADWPMEFYGTIYDRLFCSMLSLFLSLKRPRSVREAWSDSGLSLMLWSVILWIEPLPTRPS